jgi:ABC-type sugar transport system permease subunit
MLTGFYNTKRVFPFLLVIPTILLIFGVQIYPVFYAINLTLHDVDFIVPGPFVGLENFRDVLSDDVFWTVLGNSFRFAFGSLVGVLVLGFGLALILNQRIRFRAGFRAIVLLPWVMSSIVSMTLVKWMLTPNYGLVNAFLVTVGLSAVSFLTDPTWAPLAVIGGNVWRSTAYVMVLVLAGLQSIPEVLYEAARIDGATATQRFWSITLPLIRTPLLIICVILTMSYFSIVVPTMVITAGGPGMTTETLDLHMYNTAFVDFRIDEAACMGMAIFVINIAFSLIYIRLLRSEVYY